MKEHTIGRVPPTQTAVRDILRRLERRGSKRNRDGMARYGIVADKVFGVSVSDLRAIAKQYGRSHALASALWKSGWYEARMLCAFVDEPARVTIAQMQRQVKAFDNWAICDALCFHLYDKTPHAWTMIDRWATREEEFVRRAAFALLASVALHDKSAPDQPFLKRLVLIERSAFDPRNFVKKGVSWALRGIGKRNSKLRAAARKVAARLSTSKEPAARWVGKDAERELSART
jgi:3-methyladenine DNA glycosylase AlkD